MATLNEPSNIGMLSNDSLMIKRIFLNFIQSYFAQHTKYSWSLGPDSKILIIDKYAMDLTQTAKKPSIVLSRGGMRWANSSIGQLSQRSVVSSNATFTDLSVGTITLNCIAKNGIVCEELALTLRNLFTTYKLQLKKVGIHSIDNIAIDEERTLMADSDIVLTVVPVTIQYSKQSTLKYLQDFYSVNAILTFSGTNYGGYSGYITPENSSIFQLYENQHYTTWDSGIIFNSGFAPPAGSVINLTYIDEATLQTIEEVASGTINNVNRVFSTSYPIYGDYPILTDIIYEFSNEESSYTPIYTYYCNPMDWDLFREEDSIMYGTAGNLNFNLTAPLITYPAYFWKGLNWSPKLVSMNYDDVGMYSDQYITVGDKFTIALSIMPALSEVGGTLLTIGRHPLSQILIGYASMGAEYTSHTFSFKYQNELGRYVHVCAISGIWANQGVRLACSFDILNSGFSFAYIANNASFGATTIPLFSGVGSFHYSSVDGIMATGITDPYMTLASMWGSYTTGFAEVRFYSDQVFSTSGLFDICQSLKLGKK